MLAFTFLSFVFNWNVSINTITPSLKTKTELHSSAFCKIENNPHSKDSINFSNVFIFTLKGDLTQEKAEKIIDYILNKKGVENVYVNLTSKRIIIHVADGIDYQSITNLINITRHRFLLEE